MSSLEKLSIRGIRSFSPNRDEIIEFYHPLTVILGDNGSGKTTIIECLKIACTGSLPPGAKSGQSFVHDTRIAGTTEVKGSVKLRFRNRAGNAMVVQRTFQVVQGKGKSTYKALDGAIRVQNAVGESVSMSHKCAELDRHIPDMLGVSKAILESVIFCHQEESTWPLQAGAELKKRFDDIFESARYTKALDAIRKLRKARNEDAKDYKRDLEILNVKVTAAEEIRDKIDEANEKLVRVKAETEEFDSNVESAEETLGDMEKLHRDIEQQHLALDRLEREEAQKQESVQAAYDSISEMMSDTDAELLGLLANYDNVIKTHQDNCKQLEYQESQLKEETTSSQKQFTELSKSKAAVESKIESHQQLVTELLDHAATIGTTYQLRTQPLSSQEDDVRSFLSKFQHFVNGKTEGLAQLDARRQQAEDVLNAALADLKSDHNHAKKELKTKHDAIKDLNTEKKKNSTRLKELTAMAIPSTREVAEAERLVDEATQDIQKFRDDHNLAAVKSDIEGIGKKIHDTKYEVGQLNNKIKLLQGTEVATMRLNGSEQEYREKEEDLKAKLVDKAAEYQRLFDQVPSSDPESLVQTIQHLEDLLLRRKADLKNKSALLHAATKKLQENAASSKHVEKSLADLRLEKNEIERGPIGELKRAVEEFAPGEDIRNAEDVLQRAEKAYLAAKDKTVRCTNTIKFLEIFKKKGIKDKSCPLCVRSMSPEEEALFVRTINEKTDDNKVKEKIAKAEAAEAAALRAWKDIDAKMPSWRKWMRMEAQINTTSSELDTLYAAQRSFQGDVNDTTQQRELAQSQVDDVDEAFRAFTALTGTVDELRKLKSKIENERESLRSAHIDELGADAPSLADVRRSRDEKEEEIEGLNRQLNLKQTELQRGQEKLQQLQSNLYKKKEAKMKAEQQRQEYETALVEQGSLKDQEKTLRDQIAELSASEPLLEQRVKDKAKELQDSRSDFAARLQQVRSEEQQCREHLLLFEQKWRTIEEQKTERLEDHLKQLAKQIALTRQKEIAATHSLQDLAPKIASAREALSSQEAFERRIRDNLNHRRLKREREELRAEVEALKVTISSLPALGDVSRRVQGAKEVLNEARDKRSTLQGRMQQLQEYIRDLKIQLRGADYKNIDEKHRQKLIEHETTMMAVADLDKYHKALDQSLLLYHKTKVEEINTIIKSLWQITYKGQDIDTIEIVSGQDMDTGTISKAARSYDYRVVMKKGGALIDMRGRCSAGQKVLAALVIRLALAETFCLNCGILALDEPTTNLDTENKFGLAQAITDILNARSEQHNFQLLCITHDEEFVHMLSEAQAMSSVRPEYYWRISREDIGNNRFCSKVERREWRDSN